MYSPAIVSTVRREPTRLSATSSPAESVASIFLFAGRSVVTPVLPISSMNRLVSTCCALSGSVLAFARRQPLQVLAGDRCSRLELERALVGLARFLDLAGLAERLAEAVVGVGVVREDAR